MTSPEMSAHAKEWELLLKCASPRCDATNLKELLEQTDFSAALKLADEHGVTGLLAARLGEFGRECVPAGALEELQEKRRAQLLMSLGMTAELLALLEKFRVVGIEALAVKGPVLSVQAYGDAGMRQFGDLDLMVRDRDILRATELMIGAGFKEEVPLSAIRERKIPGEYVFNRQKNNLRVELHTEFTLRYFPKTVDIEGMFERQICVRIDAHDVPGLSLEDELVMICVHGAKDLWERLLWIADVAGFLERQTKLDWRRVEELANEARAARMLHVGLKLSNALLRAPLPEEIAARVRSDSTAEKLAARIARWVPAAGYAPPSLVERAILRMRLRGGVFAGPIYLLRLSLSPTEDDWAERGEAKRSGWFAAAIRPFRLVRKYGQDGKK
jgi:Uncharacterised nucleotidyltransferase